MTGKKGHIFGSPCGSQCWRHKDGKKELNEGDSGREARVLSLSQLYLRCEVSGKEHPFKWTPEDLWLESSQGPERKGARPKHRRPATGVRISSVVKKCSFLRLTSEPWNQNLYGWGLGVYRFIKLLGDSSLTPTKP